MSATDPVAVVAILKKTGTSPKLIMFIVGESLMNDGTAMVMFTLFYNLLHGQKYSVLGIIGFSFDAIVGSVLLGVAFGGVVVLINYYHSMQSFRFISFRYIGFEQQIDH